MKRTRDDTYAASQLKRPPGSSRGDSYGQSQAPGGGGEGGGGGGTGGGEATSQKLTTDDALAYLKQVKEMFQDQREKYDMFLEVMKDFKAQRTDTAGVIARVKELFKGHNKLIYGFNTFLPKGYEITLDEDETPPKKTVEFEEAISFVNKIKKRFQKDEHVYKSFLDILNMYRKEHKDITEVYSEVATLFKDHPDLLDEFTRFLPDTSASPPPAQPVSYRHPIQRVNERSSATHTTQQIMDKQCVHRDRLLNSGHDLGVDHPELDNDKTLMKLHKEQRKHAEKDNRDRTNHDLGGRDCDNDGSRDYNLVRFAEKKKFIKKLEGFGGNTDLASSDGKDGFTSMYSQAFSFCEKVKERLGSSDDYQAFLKCLHIFSNGIIKRNDLQNLVTDLLGKYPDLMEEFNDFLERCENIDGFLAGVMSKKSFSDANSSRPVKLEDKEQKRDIDGAKEKERYREKYMAKSIQELDLSNCQRCTPSYRLLPDDYPIAPATQRSELGDLVLNDRWVSVTSGSEDFSFKHMRRNQYEESLFKCEDDRFELDMLLESVSSATKRVEELLNTFKENKINKETAFRIEDHFTALNIRSIERLYGDHGLDVIDILRKNPTLALPVILARMTQKQEEWTKCREDFNKVWAEIYAKNHYKSLDHRSFYFKQQDSKNLSTKSMVAEIKEIKEKQQKEDDIVQTIASDNKHTLVPHLEFEYSYVGIDEDMHKLIQYSCQELCSSKEQLSKVMRLWTTFLEPMLGVSPRPLGTESREDRKASNVMHSTSLSREKENRSPGALTTAVNAKHKKSANNEMGNRMLEAESISRNSHDNVDKEKSYAYSDHIFRDDTISSNCRSEKEQATVMNDPVNQAANYNVPFAVIAENIHNRTSLEMTADCSSQLHDAVGEDTCVPTGQGDVMLLSKVLYDFGEAGKVSKHHEKSSGPFKTEKEEGELSPNADFGEDNFVGYGDADMEMPKSRQSIERRHYEPCHAGEEDGCQDARGYNDADADDEDSENVSEAGEDVTGSESAGDECSQEEHEEEDLERDDVDSKAESEGEVKGMADALFAAGYGQYLPLSEQFLSSVKPVVKHVPPMFSGEERKSSRIFYGNDDFYALFRLHQTLYERIASAKINSMSAEMKLKTSKDESGLDSYSRFMSALYNLLDGSIDNTKYEDECRSIIGNHSYVLFTLDKLVYKLVKQLQAVSSDDTDSKLLQLYEYEKSRKPGKLIDSVYYANTHIILNEENIYHFECSSSPYKLLIQMMDNLNEKSELFSVSIDPNFTHYLYNEFLSVSPGKKEHHGIVLQRNKRKYAGLDEVSAMSLAMEGVQAVNGLECKIACNSSKISYVLDTEDFFVRSKKKRRLSSASSSVLSRNRKAKEERFGRFLDNIVTS